MSRRALKIAAAMLMLGATVAPASMQASAQEPCGCADCPRYTDTVAIVEVATVTIAPVTAQKPQAQKKSKTSFAWGVEAGSSIDMSANDMSSVDFNASFGLKHGWIKFLGIGAEIDIMVSNSVRSFPVYLNLKTNFQRRQSLVFMDLRGGVAANYLPNNYQQTGTYAFGGLGVNLAQGRTFSSHLSIGYTFKQFFDIETRAGETIPLSDLHMATVRLGVTF